jgi:hypothetical protein
MIPKRFIDIPLIEQYFRIEEDGAIFSLRKHKYLKPSFNTAGYLFISFSIPGHNGDNPQLVRMYAIHRLVATKYLGQCPDDKETSHKNGDKMNNHWSNLEYLTHAENILKSFREHGRIVSQHLLYPRKPFSDATKELMSNAKKKRIRFVSEGTDTIFDSIEDASQSLTTYRKKIYNCIKNNKPFSTKKDKSLHGELSFVDL